MLASNGFDGRSHQCCIEQIDGLAHECVLLYGRHGLRLPRLLTLLGSSSGRVAGNRTGSYLQYAHARARGILAKSKQVATFPTELFDEDRLLVRKMSEYAGAVNRATESLEPHHVCAYLFELAQEFNRYYEKNQVVGSDKEAHRVGLVAVYADILKAGLTILGIVAPERL